MDYTKWTRSSKPSRNALDTLVDDDDDAIEDNITLQYASDSPPPAPGEQEILTAKTGVNAHDHVVDYIPHKSIEIRVRPIARPQDFPTFAYNPFIKSIQEELKDNGVLKYVALKEDGAEEQFSFEEVIDLPGGQQALKRFQGETIPDAESEGSYGSEDVMVTTRVTRKSTKRPGFVDLSTIAFSEDEDEIVRPTRRKTSKRNDVLKGTFLPQPGSSEVDTEESAEDLARGSRLRRSTLRKQSSRPTRTTKNSNPSYNDSLLASPWSDEGLLKKRGRPSTTGTGPLRRSGRERKEGNMREVAEDDIPEATVQAEKPPVPKVTGAKEAFKKLPITDAFRCRHLQVCDVCNGAPETAGKGFLIYCQGCSLAYHVPCLGSRNGRDHVVTKVGEKDFVLQCRRCVQIAQKKDQMAPQHGKCTFCGVAGVSCRPFRQPTTAREEQKERERNDGVDPVTVVPSKLINNASNVLFRCVSCYQAFHMHHLPPKIDEHSMIEKQDDSAKAGKRFSEYSQTWLCLDCETGPEEIGALVAWRPKNVDAYEPGRTVEEVPEDEKEYLVKWQNKSYYRSTWKNGAWVWGKTNVSMRKAFARKDDYGNLPKMRTEDAIPEDYLRVDIVFDVEYNNKVTVEIEEVDRARIREVKLAMVKYKGLAYEDAVWEEPPPTEDKERYADFKTAYDDWVRGKYMHVPTANTLSANIRKARALNFEERILQKEQPKSLKGGELMQHQQDGLNWLLYKWYSSQNGILADEMGLGKTIQIIAFMTTLQEKFNLAPFLIVVPNATCANWRREIKQWAPNLRVATFFGSAAARDLARRYELFPRQDKNLRCHVVVTSYDAAQDENCQRVFNRISWTALVVDEGQRLKNDKNLLYHALNNLKVSFTVLLTGTPIQNNPRELFNLLAFLDKSLDVQKLEEENQELTQEKVEKVHEVLKSFILRRTKRQTLKDLPAMAQIIVPITMSPLQKKLYKSILGKNADLLKSIFGGEQQGSIRGLRNILVQLRQCLCHPYVYNQDIEGRTEEASSHRRLVEASAKLQILDIMLPKLKERGHRVLIFSQFLHMLTIIEDFLSGLALEHLRLDGTMGSLDKQKCIDAFNAPNSSVFALLLSTRAGGVGINLATADTVIIMDPDFNPHQDIQAISRAHRLGQQKKVLVFQLMTRMSAEEKILQIGKKKMALDHVLIEQMDRDEEDGQDLESVLRYGAEALFKDDVTHDIRYDSTSVDKLLDRSKIEDTEKGKDDSAESSFSFARIWQNESLAMADSSVIGVEASANADDVWQKIMEERQRQADEVKGKKEQLGRGKRNRKNVDYGAQAITGNEPGANFIGESEFDPDFQARVSSEEEERFGEEGEEHSDHSFQRRHSESKVVRPTQQSPQGRTFKRAKIRPPAGTSQKQSSTYHCQACNNRYGSHEVGYCPAKLAGFEFCNLCGQSHFGTPGSCLQLRSEERIRTYLKALANSPEDKNIVDIARRHMKLDLGNVVQEKKRKHDATFSRQAIHNGTHRPYNGVTTNHSDAIKREAIMPSANFRASNGVQAMPGPTSSTKSTVYGGHAPLEAKSHFFTPSIRPDSVGTTQFPFSTQHAHPYLGQNTQNTSHQHHLMPNTSYSFITQTHGLPRPSQHQDSTHATFAG